MSYNSYVVREADEPYQTWGVSCIGDQADAMLRFCSMHKLRLDEWWPELGKFQANGEWYWINRIK